MDHLLMMGLNHRTASIQVREHLAGACENVARIPQQLVSQDEKNLSSESLVLSTCNRTEIYVVTNDLVCGEKSLRDYFLARPGLGAASISQFLYTLCDRSAVEHLLRVACGLDSMILGEFEILGQVRRAYETALEHKTIGAILSALFVAAIHTGKRARTETSIGRGAASAASAAVQLAREKLGGLKDKRVLVIGAGEMGQRVAKNLSADGVHAIVIANRAFDRAVAIARDLGGYAIRFDELANALRDADLVISATGAPHLVLDATMIARAMQARPSHALCVIDIAVPRDVDPRAAHIANVHLFHLDDLKEIARENVAEREKEVESVKAIIAEELERFWGWWMERRAAPMIAELHERAEVIRIAELDKSLRRLHHLDLSERDRNVIAALSVSIVKKLLAAPTASLKEAVITGDGAIYLETIRKLFDLECRTPALSEASSNVQCEANGTKPLNRVLDLSVHSSV